MDSKDKLTRSRCNKLHELPPFDTEWQQTAWCPDCDYYDCGICDNPIRRGCNAACPFDGTALPLREVAVEPPNEEPRKPLGSRLCEVPETQLPSKPLEQAIKNRILNRIGRRMQALAIELTGRDLIVRGSAPCYYVKQLALQGVLDVLNSDHQTKIECNLQVVVRLPGPTEPTARSENLLQVLNPDEVTT